jgi:hypothetical protein
MAKAKKKISARERLDTMAAWGPKEKRAAHWKNRIKAAEVREESEKFIEGLKAARDAELDEMDDD